MPDEALAVLDMDEVATSYRDLLRSVHADIFLACRNGAIGAFCHVCPVREPDRDAHPELTTAELTALYADPHARGTGAGHVAHEAGLLHLPSSGFEYAVLWGLRDNNPAQVFYQRQGWSSDHVAREAEVSGAAVPMLRWSRPVSSRRNYNERPGAITVPVRDGPVSRLESTLPPEGTSTRRGG